MIKFRLPSVSEEYRNREVYVEAVFGDRLETQPLFDMENLSITMPSNGNSESGIAWFKSLFQFNPQNSLLVGLSVDYGIEGLRNLQEWVDVWLQIKSLDARLRLLDTPRDLEVDYTEYTWFHPDGRLLAGLYRDDLKQPISPARLRVAPDFDLLISDGQYRGWILWNPITRISWDWDTYEGESEAELLPLMHEYFRLIVLDENQDRMLKGDPEHFAELIKLHEETRVAEGIQSRKMALHKSIGWMLYMHYDYDGDNEYHD